MRQQELLEDSAKQKLAQILSLNHGSHILLHAYARAYVREKQQHKILVELLLIKRLLCLPSRTPSKRSSVYAAIHVHNASHLQEFGRKQIL